ncbi:MAG: DNA alkylation repair protein [Anaerolineaceae bacterium]|nr:DNA alkylation repair protein [Anaerolineaceae bacterium]
MPAVELIRLRTQIHGLATRFHDPVAFCSGLKDILDQYANRAYRPGQVVKPQPLLPSYRVSPLILRELEMELVRICQGQPDQALRVIEVLWKDAYLETRLLASILLGAVPISRADAVIGLLHAWAQPEENFRIVDTLFQNGTTTLRRQGAGRLLQLAEEWIGSSSIDIQGIGVRILIPLVQDTSFENLPPVYRLLTGLVQSVPGKIQADLNAILEALIHRSPAETAFFLRQALPMAQGQATARLIRRCLPSFTAEQQTILRAAIQATNLT